jgi:hypoxanthine phosphoribosyltransferase
MESITIHDRKFRLYIPARKIQEAVRRMASVINKNLGNKEVVLIAVLNGAFIFASDLIRQLNFNCRVSFVKLASYEGMKNTGQIRELMGIHEVLAGKTILVIEDIVDTGATLEEVINSVREHQPAEIRVVTLLFKPDAYESNLKLDYIGFRIPNDFVVGYGLDYDGFGRNLEDIYTVVES